MNIYSKYSLKNANWGHKLGQILLCQLSIFNPCSGSRSIIVTLDVLFLPRDRQTPFQALDSDFPYRTTQVCQSPSHILAKNSHNPFPIPPVLVIFPDIFLYLPIPQTSHR